MFGKFKTLAKWLKSQLIVLYLAYKDPRVPWYSKIFTLFVVAYAFSPIDLIPDFIPVLGYLDDLILIPLGVHIALKIIPAAVLEECRMKAAEQMKENKPQNWMMGILFILIWISLAVGIVFYVYRYLHHKY